MGQSHFGYHFGLADASSFCSMVTWSSPNKHMALIGSLLQKHVSSKYLVVPGILRSARLSPWAWERALGIEERIEGLPEWRGLRTTGWCRDRSFGAASQRCDARKDQSSKGCPAKNIENSLDSSFEIQFKLSKPHETFEKKGTRVILSLLNIWPNNKMIN